MSCSLQFHGLQACLACLSFTVSWSLLKSMSMESVMLSNNLILCHPLLHLRSIFPTLRVYSNELTIHIRWPKYWSFGFSISPSNESDQIRSDQSLSHVRIFVTPWTIACQASLSITNSRSSLRLMSIESVMPSSHLTLCHPLLLPSIFPSIRVFSSESVLYIRWPKYWSFGFSISPCNEYSGLISFRIDWFDLLTVQGTPKNLPQHHSSKASSLQCSAFFMVQLSHPYPTTGENIALTIQNYFVGKVMSLLFNMLSRFVIAFLPRSKHLLIL